MDEKSVALPLAFVLALGASGAAAQVPIGSPEALNPGNLRAVAENGAKRLGITLDLPSPADPRGRTKLTQWFNGGPPTCFAGGWRRC
jgi:hypothetical protein